MVMVWPAAAAAAAAVFSFVLLHTPAYAKKANFKSSPTERISGERKEEVFRFALFRFSLPS
jgi:hypothetical protein